MFARIVNEDFYLTYTYTTTVISLIINAYLVFLIIVTRVEHVSRENVPKFIPSGTRFSNPTEINHTMVDAYSDWLLPLVVAKLCDLRHFRFGIAICIDSTNFHACHITGFGFIFWSNRLYAASTAVGTWACICWMFFFYQTFALLTFHFVYRYVHLCDLPWLSSMRLNPYRKWISFAVVSDVLFVGAFCIDALAMFAPTEMTRKTFASLLQESYGIDLLAPNQPGYLAAVYWQTLDDIGTRHYHASSILAMCVPMILFAISASVIGFCLVNVLRALRPTQFKLSEKSRNMQKQLILALIWQLLILTDCDSINNIVTPAGKALLGYIVPVDWLGGMGSMAAIVGQLYPILDPLLILVFVKGGKVAVVTGGNAGIGLETVRELNLRGAKVYILARSEQRASAAIAELVKGGCDYSRLIYVNCDLGDKESIRKCAAELSKRETRIDILVNNAGVVMGSYEKTKEGHEMTWGTNHLGHFLLTELLLPLIERSDEGRIVNVSSLAQAFSPAIDLATIDDREDFDKGKSYPKSKLANVMHARELSRRLRARGLTNVTANSLHPGSIYTELLRNVHFGFKMLAFVASIFMKSVKDGAQTTLYCALSTELKGVLGQYFSDCARKTESSLALDDLACKQLYDYSLKAVGLA